MMLTLLESEMQGFQSNDELTIRPLEEAISAGDGVIAIGSLSMIICASPNGCTAPGGVDVEFSCAALKRCVMS